MNGQEHPSKSLHSFDHAMHPDPAVRGQGVMALPLGRVSEVTQLTHAPDFACRDVLFL
jgi:hypothetical protein